MFFTLTFYYFNFYSLFQELNSSTDAQLLGTNYIYTYAAANFATKLFLQLTGTKFIENVCLCNSFYSITVTFIHIFNPRAGAGVTETKATNWL